VTTTSSLLPRPNEQFSSPGERHLHALAGELPILVPRAFLGERSKA